MDQDERHSIYIYLEVWQQDHQIFWRNYAFGELDRMGEIVLQGRAVLA